MQRKITRVIAAITSCLMFPTSSFAVLGVGDVVTDPGSYVYLAQDVEVSQSQLASMYQQLETAKQSYEELQKTLDETIAIKTKLEGYYNFANKTIKGLKHIENMPEEIFAPIANEMTRRTEQLGTPSKKEITWKQLGRDLENLNRGVFIDPKTGKPKPGASGIGNTRRIEYIQGAHYANLLNAEMQLTLLKKRNERANALVKDAKAAQNVNEQQAVTSALLAELLSGQNEMILLLSNMARAESASKFRKRKFDHSLITGNPSREKSEFPKPEPIEF